MSPTPDSLDPVCGQAVAVAGSVWMTEHRGLRFHFCSEHCQQRFAINPRAFSGRIRISKLPPIIKRHALRFTKCGSDVLATVSETLHRMPGVRSLTPDEGRLTLEYDLRSVALEQIEAAASAGGLPMRGGLHELRRAWWRFAENNELENAASTGGACCSRPPARLR